MGTKKNIYELELGGEHRYTVEVYSTHVLDRGEAAGFKIYNPTDGGEIYEVQENKEEVLRDQVNIVSAHRT